MSSADGRKAVRVRIIGRVQGVWYRGWTIEEATRRGLAGWVRNRRDGSVEALFVGPPEQVDHMMNACFSGPPAARVDTVEHAPDPCVNACGFTQRPTV